MEQSDKPREPKKKFHYVRLNRKLNPKPPKEKTKYRDLIPIAGVKPKPNMTEWQLKTYNKFMQVKPGETMEEWKKRTRNRRVLSEDEIQSNAAMEKIRIYSRKNAKSAREYKNRLYMDQTVVRDHDFLKYYGVLINFFAIKYAIRKDDFEQLFFFHDHDPFTRGKFENVATLTFGNSNGVFRRFVESGYIYPVIKYNRNSLDEEVAINLGVYKVNRVVVKMVNEFYKVLSKDKELRIGSQHQPGFVGMPKELKDVFIDMNQEVNEIKSGRKPQQEMTDID